MRILQLFAIVVMLTVQADLGFADYYMDESGHIRDRLPTPRKPNANEITISREFVEDGVYFYANNRTDHAFCVRGYIRSSHEGCGLGGGSTGRDAYTFVLRSYEQQVRAGDRRWLCVVTDPVRRWSADIRLLVAEVSRLPGYSNRQHDEKWIYEGCNNLPYDRTKVWE